MDTQLVNDIEAFILNHWLETGNEPSVLEVATRFGVTEPDVDTFVIHDEDYITCLCCGAVLELDEVPCMACGYPANTCDEDIDDD